MILAPVLALALQGATPPLLRDPTFLAAHEAWAACTNRVADEAAGSARSAEEIAAAALAACEAEQAATQRAVLAFSGETRGAEEMAVLLNGNREGLVGRVRELRRRATGPPPPATVDQLIEAWVHCLVGQIDAAAADMPEARAVDAAFGACAATEEALRRQAIALGGERRANEFIRRARAANREHLIAHLRERRR